MIGVALGTKKNVEFGAVPRHGGGAMETFNFLFLITCNRTGAEHERAVKLQGSDAEPFADIADRAHDIACDWALGKLGHGDYEVEEV